MAKKRICRAVALAVEKMPGSVLDRAWTRAWVTLRVPHVKKEKARNC